MSTSDNSNARHIVIFDTTLRDGEQSPGCSMNLEEKLEVAQALVDLGVDVIEAGFPIASPGDFEAVREIARNVRHGDVGHGHVEHDHEVDKRQRQRSESELRAFELRRRIHEGKRR